MKVDADDINQETCSKDEFLDDSDNCEYDDIYEMYEEDLSTDIILNDDNSEDTDNKNSVIHNKPYKISRQRNTEQKANYVCEYCGHYFVSRNQCLTHLRRHTGEKPFICDYCEKKFVTNNELKRHIRVHTGERPYSCQYCDRSYPDATKRLKHERSHTNERNFFCPQCGKAFISSGVLKSHLVTHTGERLFKCELCQKSFQRRTHLVTHYRSRSHKLKEMNQKH